MAQFLGILLSTPLPGKLLRLKMKSSVTRSILKAFFFPSELCSFWSFNLNQAQLHYMGQFLSCAVWERDLPKRGAGWAFLAPASVWGDLSSLAGSRCSHLELGHLPGPDSSEESQWPSALLGNGETPSQMSRPRSSASQILSLDIFYCSNSREKRETRRKAGDSV